MFSIDRAARTRRVAVGVLVGLGAALAAGAGPPGDICYLRETDGFWQAWVMNGKGRKQIQLTRSAVDKVRCTWSGRSGRLLVTTTAGTVLRVDRRTGSESPVTSAPAGITDATALPDGGGWLYSSPGAGIDTDDIWLAREETSEPRRLTHEPFLEHFPVVCPDGRTLLYVGGRGGDEHDIFRIGLEPAGVTQSEKLTGGELYNFEPSCAASGAIAFSSNRTGDGNYELWRMDAGGGNAIRLTRDPSADTHPSWSPDERFIAFESTRDGSRGIYRLDLRRSKVKRLTPRGVTARAPVWGDGR